MGLLDFLENIPVLQHIPEIWRIATGQQEDEQSAPIQAPPPSKQSIAQSQPPSQPPTVETIWREKENTLRQIYSASDQFRELTPQEQSRIIKLSLQKPQVFMDIVSKDPSLSKQWGELTEEERKSFVSKLYSPAEKPLKEPYLDPTSWLPIGIARQVITRGAASLAKTVGAVASGDVAGELAKEAYEAKTGKEAPWWVGVGADVLSGFTPDIVKSAVRIFSKTKTPEEAVKVLEKVEEQITNNDKKAAIREIRNRVEALTTEKEQTAPTSKISEEDILSKVEAQPTEEPPLFAKANKVEAEKVSEDVIGKGEIKAPKGGEAITEENIIPKPEEIKPTEAKPTTEDAQLFAKINTDKTKEGIVKTAEEATTVEEGKIKTVNVGGIRFADPEEHPEIAKRQAEIWTEFENAQRGYRISRIAPDSYDLEFRGVKSSFPDWIPEAYRRRRFIDQVLNAIRQDELPKSKPARELYEIFKEKIEEPLKEVEGKAQDFALEFYSGGPSLKQIREFLRVPEDPLKNAPPEVAEQASMSRFASLANLKRWILPQYEWLKDNPETVKVYRAAKAYTEGLEKDLNRWMGDRLEKLKEALNKLPEGEKLKLVDYIEGKTDDISEDTKAVGKAVRQYLDNIYNYAKEQGLDISYRENYFPHIFDGNIRVKVGNEFKSAKTWDEAIEIARRGIQEGKEVNIKAMLPPDVYELKITNPRFWTLINKLKNGVELTEDEIKQAVKEAGIGIRPRYRFVGNLLERKYDIEGYIKDPETALSLYTFNIVKKIHQDRFLKEFEKVYEKVGNPRVREVLDDYRKQVLGYPTKPEQFIADTINAFFKTPLGRWWLKSIGKSLGTEITPFDVRRAAGSTSFWVNYLPDLGLSVSSALVNATQNLTHTFPALGFRKSALAGAVKYAKGLLFNNAKIKQELFDAGIITEYGFEGAGKLKLDKNPVRLAGNIAMAPFSGTEIMNRVMAYGAAKEYGLKEGVRGMLKTLDLLGVAKHDPLYKLVQDPSVPLEKKAMEFAKEVVDKTHFRYEKFASPKLLGGSLSKLIAPYKTYLINHLVFSARMLSKAKMNPREAILFFAVPVLLAGKYGNPITAWTWDLLSKLYEHVTDRDLEEDIKSKLGKVGTILLEGLPRQAGFDIRGAIKLDFPKPFDASFYGRPVKLAKDIYDIAGGTKGWDEIKKELTPRFVKNFAEAYDILKTGFVKDSKGRIIKEGSAKDAVLRALGIKPPEYYDFLEKKDLIFKLDKKFQQEYDPLVNDLVDAIISNDTKKVKDTAERLRDELTRLGEKVKNTDGQRQKVYLYLLMRLQGALEPSAIERRIKNKVAPFSSDKKELILTE